MSEYSPHALFQPRYALTTTAISETRSLAENPKDIAVKFGTESEREIETLVLAALHLFDSELRRVPGSAS